MIGNPTIGIIGGKGVLGGHFATFFKEKGLKVLVSDKDTKLSNLDLVEKSDIIIVSVPIHIAPTVIKEVLPHLAKNKALVDFSSIKHNSLKAMMKSKSEVLGLHPMFGNTNPIPGQSIIVCRTSKSGPLCEWMINFLEQSGSRLVEMGAKDHDKAMSIVQGMVHFADISFIDGLRRLKKPIKELAKVSSRASELKILFAARLIAQDPYLYGNIQMSNPHTLSTLEKYQKSVDELTKIVKRKDIEAFVKYFELNKKYLGAYQSKAMDESNELIDHFNELHHPEKSIKNPKPQKNDIAVLGPANSYTDIAAGKYSKNQKFYAKSIDEVFELVENGKVAEGIIPIENKLNGTLGETLDGLFNCKVHIVSEINVKIDHCLLMLEKAKKSDIKVVMSHSQALAQCQKYIRKNFPKAQLIEYASTAAAVEKLLSSPSKNIAVIASHQAAEKNNLKIFSSSIADKKENSTSFVVIKKGEFNCESAAHGQKVSIAFYFGKNKPGSLFAIFKIFAEAKINLSKIESRPTKAKFGEYIFYLDLDGNFQDKQVRSTLKQVERQVAGLKVLGGY